MPGLNVSLGVQNTMRFAHIARSARKPRSSWPKAQDRHACPELKKPRFSRIEWPREGGKSTTGQKFADDLAQEMGASQYKKIPHPKRLGLQENGQPVLLAQQAYWLNPTVNVSSPRASLHTVGKFRPFCAFSRINICFGRQLGHMHRTNFNNLRQYKACKRQDQHSF